MCPSRVRKRQGEFRLQGSHPAQAGAAAATGNKRGGNQRGINTETKQGQTKAQEKSQQWRKWESRRESHRRWGEGNGGGRAEGPPGAEAGKQEETKNKRRKTKGQ